MPRDVVRFERFPVSVDEKQRVAQRPGGKGDIVNLLVGALRDAKIMVVLRYQ